MGDEEHMDFGGEGPTLRRPLFTDPPSHFGFADYHRNERVEGQSSDLLGNGGRNSEGAATSNEHPASTQHVAEVHNDIEDII
jgi:hypothetical protein